MPFFDNAELSPLRPAETISLASCNFLKDIYSDDPYKFAATLFEEAIVTGKISAIDDGIDILESSVVAVTDRGRADALAAFAELFAARAIGVKLPDVSIDAIRSNFQTILFQQAKAMMSYTCNTESDSKIRNYLQGYLGEMIIQHISLDDELEHISQVLFPSSPREENPPSETPYKYILHRHDLHTAPVFGRRPGWTLKLPATLQAVRD